MAVQTSTIRRIATKILLPVIGEVDKPSAAPRLCRRLRLSLKNDLDQNAGMLADEVIE
jgi:hypothetical protein